MITLVKKLREATGLGLKECYDAAESSGGDFEKALASVRGKYTPVIIPATGTNGLLAFDIRQSGYNTVECVVADIRTDTDFGANCEETWDFAQQLVRTPLYAEDLLKRIQTLTKESVTIKELTPYMIAARSYGSYLHHDNKSLGLVFFSNLIDPKIAKDIAMHLVAIVPEPISIGLDDFPPEALEAEVEFLKKKGEGKPEHIQKKILTDGLLKFQKNLCLLSQPFIKDPNVNIASLLPTDCSIVHFECRKIR